MIDNDMIIAGADEKEHDEIMLKAIKRAEEKNMKFTKKKYNSKSRNWNVWVEF